MESTTPVTETEAQQAERSLCSLPADVRVSARALRNVEWIERHLRVPGGKHVGRRLRLRMWQRRFMHAAYPDEGYVRTAVISIARKRGKTPFAAMLVLLHLVGPEAVRNGELYSSAQSRDQAAIVYKYAEQMLRMSPELDAWCTVRSSRKEIHCTELGTTYKALSKEAKTKYGLGPCFLVHDELGQVKGPTSELYDALETATLAQERPLSLIISTQAASDADLLSQIIDTAQESPSPDTVIMLEYCPEKRADGSPIDLYSDEALQLAYPDMHEGTQNITELRLQADKAKRSPSAAASYRNLVLNQRTDATVPFIAREVWDSCGAAPKAAPPGTKLFLGLDLSAVADLTACVAIYDLLGVWQVLPTFWLPSEPPLRERGLRDRAPYAVWHEQGHLLTTPGKAIEYSYVAAWLFGLWRRNQFMCAFDRWAMPHLRPWLKVAGFSQHQIDTRFLPFGQGTASMSPALRVLETDALNGRLAHGKHPVLTMCSANARVTGTDANNRKLDKQRSRGRIDGMVALTMARGIAENESGAKVILG
jgi:phage terminase large subunit-like protein